ncbi:potassium channel family protein [Nostocoides sp.]|uniref:potassium channel family protein n=2 Tax=Nostocoides sp. TaxID=1917966 RepID=UPI002C3355EB|nr:TrkA family potassium uptake protein [Tetrasphaera sp.]
MAKQLDTASGVVVIGLGRFGKSLALELENDGVEVLGIDLDRHTVDMLAGRLTHVVQADSTDIEVMRQLSVHEFDRAVIAIGSNLESSVLTAFVLKQLGVDLVWAKATSESMRQILLKIGVNQVVRPEHDMGRRVAHLVRGKMIDYIEFDDGFAIVKTTPPKNILGVTLAASGVRTKYGVTIVGIKTPGNDFTYATPESIVTAGDLVIVSGERHRVERFSNEP